MTSKFDIFGKQTPTDQVMRVIKEYFPHEVDYKETKDLHWIAHNIGPRFCTMKFSKLTGNWYAHRESSQMVHKLLHTNDSGTWVNAYSIAFFLDPKDAIRFKLARA